MTKFFAESCQSQNFRTFCSVHGRKKPYECEICIKFFFLQGKLSRHIALIHDGKKAYKCDVFDKFFLLIDNLVRHFISVHFFLLKGSPKEFRWFYHEGKKPNNVRFVTIFFWILSISKFSQFLLCSWRDEALWMWELWQILSSKIKLNL